MEGDLSLLSIPDLLQMICLGGYNRDIHLFDGPTQVGVIAIRNGRIDRCFGFGMWGEAAFFKVVQLRRGRYKVNDAQDMSASDATLTAHSWQELLMEAARRQDEAKHVAQPAAAVAAANGRVITFPSPDCHELSFEGLSGVTPATLPRLASVPPAAPAEYVHAENSGILSMMVDSRSNSTSAASPAGMTSEITNLLEEATTCYLRRDLARAETLLQQCLALHPDHKQALQNLERIRRKKSP